MSKLIDRISRKIGSGERLTEADALQLYQSSDLTELGQLANRYNLAQNGDQVFYNINRHINPTNICALSCKFCAYSRKPGDPGAYAFTIDEMVVKATEAVEQGATEVHMVGGLHPRWRLDYYIEMLNAIKTAWPDLHIKAFTAVELDWLAKRARLSIAELITKLRSAGLDSMPGGGAEIFDPAIRDAICETKVDADRWIDIHRTAHNLGLHSNATMLYGHIESYAHRVDHMARLRRLQDETAGFNAFIPLSFQPFQNEMGIKRYTFGYDDLKNIAIARLFLDNFKHIKAYWIMLGQDIAQLALHYGANDLDGTVIEEKISRMAGGRAGMVMQRSSIEDLISRADRQPTERDTLYNPVIKSRSGPHKATGRDTADTQSTPKQSMIKKSTNKKLTIEEPAPAEANRQTVGASSTGLETSKQPVERLFANSLQSADGRQLGEVGRLMDLHQLAKLGNLQRQRWHGGGEAGFTTTLNLHEELKQCDGDISQLEKHLRNLPHQPAVIDWDLLKSDQWSVGENKLERANQGDQTFVPIGRDSKLPDHCLAKKITQIVETAFPDSRLRVTADSKIIVLYEEYEDDLQCWMELVCELGAKEILVAVDPTQSGSSVEQSLASITALHRLLAAKGFLTLGQVNLGEINADQINPGSTVDDYNSLDWQAFGQQIAAFNQLSIDPVSIDPVSIDPASIDPASIDQASIDQASIDQASIDPVSIDPVCSITTYDRNATDSKGDSHAASLTGLLGLIIRVDEAFRVSPIEYLRAVSLVRLGATGIRHVAAPLWRIPALSPSLGIGTKHQQLPGEKFAAIALHYGANDLGAIPIRKIDSNAVADDIRASGFTPVLRDSRFNTIGAAEGFGFTQPNGFDLMNHKPNLIA